VRSILPFTGIVDQEQLKRALILNAINPRIGGVLIRGAKGTGKSTTVRALAELLPEVDVIEDCPFRCNPLDPTNMCEVCKERVKKGDFQARKKKMDVVELPIGATEDSVVGTLNIEKAIREGIRALEPGILAKANQNILYVDEINLLPDHITDVILDAAASGWNVVEREGMSVQHPARFILVGTMNPEEGELRPQLLDRLSLHAEISTIKDPSQRVEVMKINMKYEDDPEALMKEFQGKQSELSNRIINAKELLSNIIVPDNLYQIVANMCIYLNLDGHRPDIIIIKAAKTLAAFMGRSNIDQDDILECAILALSHRTRNLGRDPPASERIIREAFNKGLIGMA
jgi:Mg-chelatase subunit ChlI